MLENDAGSRSSEGGRGGAGGGAGGGSGGGVAPQEITSDASAGARRRESDGERKGTISGLQQARASGPACPSRKRAVTDRASRSFWGAANLRQERHT